MATAKSDRNERRIGHEWTVERLLQQSAQLAGDSRCAIDSAWVADVNSVIDVDAVSDNSLAPRIAEVGGGSWTMGGTLSIRDGTLRLSADGLISSTAAVTVGGQGQDATLQFDGTWVVAPTATFDMDGLGSGTANLIVNGEVTFNAPLNLDSDGTNQVRDRRGWYADPR